MTQSKSVAGVTYTKAGAGYFEKRTLKRSAGFWGLWGLGIAAVISGDFSGWNFGTRARRAAAACSIAFVIVIVMYFTMIFSIGEMSAAHAAHRRRILLRPRGDGAVGRVRHRPRRDDRVRGRPPR